MQEVQVNVFKYDTYQEVLAALINFKPRPKGIISRLAEAAGCHRTYLTHVIKGSAHLTPDHALGICEHMSFSDSETDFFLTQVELARASTRNLKKRLNLRARKIKSNQTKIATQINQKEIQETELTPLEYYEDWRISALHILSTCRNIVSFNSMQESLNLDLPQLILYLKKLEKLGFIKVDHVHRQVLPLEKSVFVPKGSLQASLHASNWRLRNLNCDPSILEEGIRYTSVLGLSEKDAENIREIFLRAIKQGRSIAMVSPEETAYVLTLDFLKI